MRKKVRENQERERFNRLKSLLKHQPIDFCTKRCLRMSLQVSESEKFLGKICKST